MTVARSPEALLVAARRRIAATTVLGFVGVTLLTGGFVVASALNSLGHTDDTRLLAAAKARAQRLVSSGVEGPLFDPGAPVGDQREDRGLGIVYLVVDTEGGLLMAPARSQIEGLPDMGALTAARAGGSDLRDAIAAIDGLTVALRVATVPVSLRPDDPPLAYVLAALPRSDFSAERAALVNAVLFAALASLAAGALATLLIVRGSLRPIRAAFARERRFLADASHEIRTPVAVVATAADLLEREGHVAPDGLPLLGDLRAETERLRRLVGELLAFSRLEATGEMALSREEIDLAALLRSFGARAPLMSGAPDVRVELAAPDSVIGALDRRRVEGALVALIENARRYAPAGSAIELGLVVRDGVADLTVDDAGPGVPPEARERIFAPFSRLEAGSAGGEGTGLGLAIARAVAEAHGGSLAVETSPLGGARFRLRLPLTSAG